MWEDDGDNIFDPVTEHDGVIFWGPLAEMVDDGDPIVMDLDICETYYLAIAWELADYGVSYGHGSWGPWSWDGEQNRAMTDEVSGTITFTLEGPYPIPHPE